MAKSLLLALSACIAAYFMYTGFCKMSPNFNEDLHNSMKKHFVNYARVSPLRTKYNIRYKGSEYRKFVGGLELAGGLGLLVMTGRRSRTMAFLLLLITVAVMLHTYHTLGDPITKVYILLASGACVFVQMIVEFRAHSNVTSKTRKEKSS